MTVSELITMLEKCPQDAPVLIYDEGDLEELSKKPAVIKVWYSEESGYNDLAPDDEELEDGAVEEEMEGVVLE